MALKCCTQNAVAARPVKGISSLPAVTVPRISARHAVPRAAPSQRRQICMQVQASQQLEARWQSQIRDGRVKNISAKDVKQMMADGWVFLDVRPSTESVKAPVQDSVEVPLFVPDPSNDAAALIKKATDFAMGSWWLGGTHYVPNTGFLAEVQARIPQDAKVIVACQKGLRSLAACEQLARAGYQQVAWINGGLDSAKKEDVPTSNGMDVRYAGIGGLSEVLGWTEVQREESKDKFGGMNGVLRIFGFILVADVLLFAYEQVDYWQKSGTGPFGH